jgi:hypothetical protein
MNRTFPALSALAVTFSLLVFALLQRGVPTAPAIAGACADGPAVTAAPVPVAAEVTSCGVDETRVARAESPR